ncbi:TraR/DksA family transcriptional regulator [Aliiroseovarius sp. PTFE2010]|uniref:TraR/DksA family transcriptional regulator n=1 Tax=Aliiroseovarius sp. PTFE2010 TaxID=3417190 RepID=UPI003CEECF6F
MVDVRKYREQLEARLNELDARVHKLDDALDAPKSRDWDEGAQEAEGDEVMEAMGSAGMQEIRMINAALERIDADEFGYCQDCGDEISGERLDLLPFTPFCKDCAAKHDQR